MNRLLTGVAVLLMSGGAYAQKGPRGGYVDWRKDYDRALRDASRQGRPIMLYFTADW